MGQSLNSMTHQQQHHTVSKDELLYQCVSTGDVDAIKALCQQGASLEWIDRGGKTPLIVACMDSGLINVAKTLIELGANINTYRPGRHGGTPLHHAAKRGLEPTVRLLLSYGANPLVRNDDCYTPLGVARMKGHTSVVRAIESRICYFSGWLREFYGPGFLEALAPQLMSRKIWAVVIPCGPTNPMKPPRFELAIYPTLQDVQPRAVIALWKARIDEPKFHQPDPALTIFDQSTKIRYKLASVSEGDKQQLQWLYNACRGISQVMPLTAPHNTTGWGDSTNADTHNGWEAVERTEANYTGLTTANSHQNAEAINATGRGDSANTDTHNGWGAVERTEANYTGLTTANSHRNAEAIKATGWVDSTSADAHNGWGSVERSGADYHGWMDKPAKEDYNGWGAPDSGQILNQSQGVQTHSNPASDIQTSSRISLSASTAPSAPSAPPIPEEESGEGPILYPSVENSLADLHVPVVEYGASATSNVKDEVTSSSCVICWEAPVEGACIPCGHMAGCMSCLSKIKSKKGLCPVCRTKINQVIRLYAV